MPDVSLSTTALRAAGDTEGPLSFFEIAGKWSKRRDSTWPNLGKLQAAGFWRRRGFLPSKDDPLVLFRFMAEVAAPIALAPM